MHDAGAPPADAAASDASDAAVSGGAGMAGSQVSAAGSGATPRDLGVRAAGRFMPGTVLLDGRMPDEAYPKPQTVTVFSQHDNCNSPEPAGVARQLVTAKFVAGGHVLTTDRHVYYVDEVICRTGVARMPTLPSCEVFGPLRRIPRCGGTEETVIEDVSDPVKLAAGGGYVYVLGAKLQRIRESDRSVREIEANPMCFGDVATDDTHVYVYDRCRGRIARAAHGTQELETLVTLTERSTLGTQLAVRGALTFFECGFQICWHDRRDDSRGKLPFSARSPLLDLAVIDGAVFAMHDPQMDPKNIRANAELTRVPLDRSPPTELGPVRWQYNTVSDEYGQRPMFHDLAATDDLVYAYQGAPWSEAGQVVRIGASGAASLALVTQTSALSVYDHRLYWTTAGGVFTALPLEPRVDSPGRVPARSWVAWGQEQFPSIAIGPQGEVAAWRVRFVDGIVAEHSIEKYDAQGTLIWSRPIAQVKPIAMPGCIAIDPRGVITAAMTPDPNSGARTLRVRFSPDGMDLSVGDDGPRILSCAADGGSLWLGGSVRLEKRDPTDALEWSNPSLTGKSERVALYVRTLRVVSNGALALVDFSGDLTLNGQTFKRHDADPVGYLLVQLDAGGTVRWAVQSEGARPQDVARLADGRTVLLLGQSAGLETKIAGQPVPALGFAPTYVLLAWIDGNGALQRTRIYDMPGASQLGVRANGHLLMLSDMPTRPLRLLPDTRPGAGMQSIALVELDPEGELVEAFDINATDPSFATSNSAGTGLEAAQLVVQGDRVWLSGTPHRIFSPETSGEPRTALDGKVAVLMQLTLP